MKTDVVYRRAYNDALDLLGTLETGAALPSETKLSDCLGVSRTTVRKVLAALQESGFLQAGRPLHKLARPGEIARYGWSETLAHPERAERQFMHWVLRGGAAPGTVLGELDLAHRLNVPTMVMRELLAHFRRFGLVQAQRNGRWLFIGFNRAFAGELFEIREMFEQRAARQFATLPAHSPLWWKLQALRDAHLALHADYDRRCDEFPDLDSRFHRLVCEADPNRFVDNLFDVITLVFHYHYLWNREDEAIRNRAALDEHLDYIDALLSRDADRICQACAAHLGSARRTLMRAIPEDGAVSPACGATSAGPAARRSG